MAAISIINNGEAMSSVRSKLNNVITEVNLLDPTDWIDYSATSTVVGWTTPMTTKIIRYRVIGKMVFVSYSLYGTSNSATTSFTVPFNNVNIQNIVSGTYALNGGVQVRGMTIANVNTNVITLFQNESPTWTASGLKYMYGQFFYETA